MPWWRARRSRIAAPVRVDGRWLVDGSLAANHPIIEAQMLGADDVYAITTATVPQQASRGAVAAAMNSVSLVTARAGQRQLAEAEQNASQPGAESDLVPTSMRPHRPSISGAARAGRARRTIGRRPGWRTRSSVGVATVVVQAVVGPGSHSELVVNGSQGRSLGIRTAGRWATGTGTNEAFSPRLVDSLVDALLIVEDRGHILYANARRKQRCSVEGRGPLRCPVGRFAPERFRESSLTLSCSGWPPTRRRGALPRAHHDALQDGSSSGDVGTFSWCP